MSTAYGRPPTSKIAFYDGSTSFFSLDPTILAGNISHALSDPTFLAFRVFFYLDGDTGLFGRYSDERVAAGTQNPNCALAYFKRIGDTRRFDMLQQVINILEQVQTEASHCFQSVSGLTEAWSRSMSDVVLKDKTVELKLTESVDWRFIRAITMLRNIMYDYNRMVYVLPVNLRTFVLQVFVTELRIFEEAVDENGNYSDLYQKIFGVSSKTFGDTVFEVQNSTFTRNSMKQFAERGISQDTLLNDFVSTNFISQKDPAYRSVIEHGAYVLFTFGDSTFTFDSGSSIFGELSNIAEPSMVNANFKIAYTNLHIYDNMPMSKTTASIGTSSAGIGVVPAKQTDSTTAEAKRKSELAQAFSDAWSNSKIGNDINDIASKVSDLRANGNVLKQIWTAATKQIIDYAKDVATSTAQNLAAEAAIQASRLASKAFGNAYGFNAFDLLYMKNPQVLYSQARSGVSNLLSNNVKMIDSDSTFKKAQAQGSVYDKQQAHTPHKSLGNVYKDSM